jgi:serine/threonine-protein kinase
MSALGGLYEPGSRVRALRDRATAREAVRGAKGEATRLASALAWLGRLARSSTLTRGRRGSDLHDLSPVRGTPAARPSSEATPQSGTRPAGPRYTDIGEIDRGGMGSVRRVRDTVLLRDMAMKLVVPELGAHRSYVNRLVEEAQITSQLEHPNIVPVHDVGIDANGAAYFTMQAVNGCSLFRWLRDPARPTGSRERMGEGLQILLKVCDAISFAHSRGVIHRDLKTANVLVGEYGAVYVVDWGLARVIGPGVETLRSCGFESGSPIGTVAYISPEAARGDDGSCDERTDVFGLGAILYELVTGSMPYRGEDAEMLERAKQGQYVRVEDALGGSGISQKLLKIIRKAMAPEREDRYATAADFKQDVQRFLCHGLSLPRCAFAPGSRIVSEDAPPDVAYVILKGRCEMWKTIDGRRHVLHGVGPGDVVGESALQLKAPRGVNVEAIDTVTALVVTRTDLEEEMGEETWVWALLRGTMRRLGELELAMEAAQRATP